MVTIPKNVSKICVHTGNILNLNEVKKNAGQNSSEELVESLKIALKSWDPSTVNDSSYLEVRSNDESIKVSGVEKKELRTSVKVFITSYKKETLQEALDKLFVSLEAENVDSVVLAYSGASRESTECLQEIQQLWQVLESNVQDGRLSRIGISDVDTDLVIALYNSAKTKPSIVQINLASCCVVPPALQEFCKQNDIQLLTHNDPLDILPSSKLHAAFGLSSEGKTLTFDWILRFITLRVCRGVIAAKGYILHVQLLPKEALHKILDDSVSNCHMDWALRFHVHIKCRGVLATKAYITSICIANT